MSSLMNEYQVFPREYFSGIDVYVAFNNVPIDQIVSIQFAVQEPVIPIYGYASYTYDAVAHGARLVNGAFRINFKETMYIRSAMNKLLNSGITSSSPKSPISDIDKPGAVDDLIAWVRGKKASDIEAIAETYRSKLWGTKVVLNGGMVSYTDTHTKYGEPFFTTRDSPLAGPGFDIVLSYGDELLEIGNKYEDFPGTVKIINGVHLTGVTQIVAPTGDPIYEEYTFIARDLDNTLVNL